MNTSGRFLFHRGTDDLRRGFSTLRNDLIRLSGILALIGVLCAPGIISKLVGLLKLGVAGAGPAISVGTVIAQTAPLTLALSAVILFIPNYVEAAEGSALGRLRALTRGPWPIGFKIFLPLTFCTLVLVTTTYVSNLSGLRTDVSLRRVWDDSTDGGILTWPPLALYSFGSQYLRAYGVAAFVSAIAVGFFIARWYAQLFTYFLTSPILSSPSSWTLSWSPDGVVVLTDNAQRANPRYLDGVDKPERDSIIEAFLSGGPIGALPWKDVPSTSVPPEVETALAARDAAMEADDGSGSIRIDLA